MPDADIEAEPDENDRNEDENWKGNPRGGVPIGASDDRDDYQSQQHDVGKRNRDAAAQADVGKAVSEDERPCKHRKQEKTLDPRSVAERESKRRCCREQQSAGGSPCNAKSRKRAKTQSEGAEGS